MKLNIGWLYPELMSTYSDRGNIICLTKRCNWRGIKTEIINIDKNSKSFGNIDLLFGGGAQDRQQEIVTRDLIIKQKIINNLIENGLPGLFTCGSYQLMGHYYEPSLGKRIQGLGILDIVTIHPGLDTPRFIGNIIAEILTPDLKGSILIGFENHGGRTTLGKNAKPLAKVIKGYGNNGADGFEGAVFKNIIGTYFHGPVLPKNPRLADHLIKLALEKKYKKLIELSKLDDSLENIAHDIIMNKYGQ